MFSPTWEATPGPCRLLACDSQELTGTEGVSESCRIPDRNLGVCTETPDPDPGTIMGGALKRFLWQSAKCQQLNLPFLLSSPADEGIFSLIVLFCFQPSYAAIMTIREWQISFHFLHSQQQEITYKIGAAEKVRYCRMLRWILLDCQRDCDKAGKREKNTGGYLPLLVFSEIFFVSRTEITLGLIGELKS